MVFGANIFVVNFSKVSVLFTATFWVFIFVIMGRYKINRSSRMGQSRGLGSMKVRRAMNERHTAIISLPFKKTGSNGMAGSTNSMEMFRVTSSDIYAWAPRIGSTLKYNNAKIKAMSVSSVSTASLSTSGTHAIWTTFDQQVGSFPASGTEQENNI